jgi:hypothetical protein
MPFHAPCSSVLVAMQILISSLVVAFLVCALLLAGFWLFTETSLAHRIAERDRRRWSSRP